MFSEISLLALLTTTLATPTAVKVRAEPAPSGVSLAGIIYGGAACPQGSLESSTSDSFEKFSLVFSSVSVAIGPGVALNQNRKPCQINIDLKYPAGYQYSISQITQQGHVNIEQGVTANEISTIYFSGQTTQATATTTIPGPENKDYNVVTTVPAESAIWSQCGSGSTADSAVNLNTQFRLTSSSTSAKGTLSGGADGKLNISFGIQWRKC